MITLCEILALQEFKKHKKAHCFPKLFLSNSCCYELLQRCEDFKKVSRSTIFYFWKECMLVPKTSKSPSKNPVSIVVLSHFLVKLFQTKAGCPELTFDGETIGKFMEFPPFSD